MKSNVNSDALFAMVMTSFFVFVLIAFVCSVVGTVSEYMGVI